MKKIVFLTLFLLGVAFSFSSAQEVAWNAEIETVNTACFSNETISGVSGYETGFESVNGVSTELRSISFTGFVQTSNPCYTADYEVEKVEDDVYRFDVVSESEDGMCVECVGSLEYSASFSAEEDFTLLVLHDGEEVDRIDVERSEDSVEDKVSRFQRFLNWFSTIF